MSRFYLNVPMLFRWSVASGEARERFPECFGCQHGMGWHFWVEGLDDNFHIDGDESDKSIIPVGLDDLRDQIIKRYTLPHYYIPMDEVKRISEIRYVQDAASKLSPPEKQK